MHDLTPIARLQAGPPTLDVRPAAKLLGISGSSLYDLIRRGESPVQTIKAGTRVKVLTRSVIEVLQGTDHVRNGETAEDYRSSEGMPDARTSSGVKCVTAVCPECGAPLTSDAPAGRTA